MAKQLFVPTFRIEECLDQVRECLENGWTGLGFKTVEIESRWKEYTDLPFAHFLNSNTSGLHLALEVFKRRHGWEDGDEVITTSLTFVSSNHAILYSNLTPVFADIDEYLCLDPQSIESKITEKTRAVMFVGLGGNVGQLEAVSKLCKDKGLKLILDAAHMAGSRFEGKHVGHQADVSVFSFQAVKNLPTADSGMICFSNEQDDEHVRKLSWLGINKDTYARTAAQGAYKWMYDVEELGYKYHGNSVMAGLALVGLKYLDLDNSYRRQLASWYREAFKGVESVELVPSTPGVESSQHLFQIRVSNRDELMGALNGHDVFPGVHYRDNIQYKLYSDAEGTCPKAREASDRIVSLPMHLGITKADVDEIAGLVVRYAKA